MSCVDALEADVIARTNQYRAQHGLPALRPSLALMQAAQVHADDMATHDFLSHTGSDGSSPGQRIHAAGYPATAPWAENAGAGYRDAASVVQGWIDSAGHQANLLHGSMSEIGVGWATGPGRWGIYWVQVFGGAVTPLARICGQPSPQPTPVAPPALPPEPAPREERRQRRRHQKRQQRKQGRRLQRLREWLGARWG